jgi:hypothetical protein
MPKHTLFRCIATISLALALLAGFVLAAGQALDAQAQSDTGAPARITAGADWTVGGLCGATIQACIDNPGVLDGDRILIPAGRYTESLTLDKAVSLIGADADTTVIHALSGQRVLTITGSVITATTAISALTFTGGSVSGIGCQAACGGGILVTGTARPQIENTAIISNRAAAGGGIYMHVGSPISLINISVLSNSAVSDGGGLSTADALTLIGGRLENNAALFGGGVWAFGTVNLVDVEFISNAVTGTGGGIEAHRALTITSSLFERNSAEGWGGGLYTLDKLLMSDTIVISNAADAGGGAFVDEVATVVGSRFESNVSVSSPGGGIYTFYPLYLTDTVLISNTAGGGLGGGGLYQEIATAAVRISGGEFRGNQSAQSGGGAFSIGPLTLSGTAFINNVAAVDGGGLVAVSLATIGGRFSNNISQSGNGGGLLAYAPSILTGTEFISNQAALSGGGASFDGWGARIVDAVFAHNTAASGASIGLDQIVGEPSEFLHVTIADSSLNPGAAIAVFSGTLGITNSIIASHAIGISNTGGTVYQDYNLFSGNVLTQAGAVAGGIHSLNGNPAFVSPATGDYHIRFGSAAMDRGVDAGVTTDFDGEARPRGRGFDIGADEYAGPVVTIYLPLVIKNQ